MQGVSTYIDIDCSYCILTYKKNNKRYKERKRDKDSKNMQKKQKQIHDKEK